MRKSNSKFITNFLSEEGSKLQNRDYFGFVELDQYACYVIADSLDEDRDTNSAQMVVESIIRDFTARPSMSKRAVKSYIHEADKELKANRAGMRLKASLTVVITDYMKVRYAAVGNSRFYLSRDDLFYIQSRDQSLTRNLLDANQIPQDKAALHEERNNLYGYLGQTNPVKAEISKKTKLNDGDVFYIFTRGIWEYCDDGELMDAGKDAKEPQEILNNVEELILSKQPQEIDNYTLAVTFIDKVFRKPKGAFSFKKLLLIILPIVIAVAAVGVVYYLSYRKKVTQTVSLGTYMESGEKYLMYDNYNKARDDFNEALKLAQALKKEKEKKESDSNLKLIDQIILGDSLLLGQDYQKAMDTYLTALVLSYQSDNAGKAYIESQLDKTRQYIEIYDLMEEGDQKESYDDLAGAREAYVKAKQMASKLYFNDGKKEAIDKIAAIDEELNKRDTVAKAEEKEKQEKAEAEEKAKLEQEESKSKEEEEALKAEIDQEVKASMVQQELDNQSRLNEQKNAIEIETMGNEYFKENNYIAALTYYETARTMFEYLEMNDKVKQLEQKIGSTAGLAKTQMESKNE